MLAVLKILCPVNVCIILLKVFYGRCAMCRGSGIFKLPFCKGVKMVQKSVDLQMAETVGSSFNELRYCDKNKDNDLLPWVQHSIPKARWNQLYLSSWQCKDDHR